MKKNLMIIFLLVISVLVLIGCKDDTLKNNEKKNENDQSNNIELQDELGLSIGESGLVGSMLGKTIITLESVELVDEFYLEYSDSYTTLFVMHLTIRNVGDEAFSPEEVLNSGLLFGSDYEEGGHSKWMYYDEISEKWQDKLEPNEKTSGVIVFNFSKEDEYQLVFGDKRSSAKYVDSSNIISFTFKHSEIIEAK